MHPLADRQGALRQFVQRPADGVVRLGGGVRTTHLPEHLLFADHRGIQAAGHREQVLDGRFGIAHVGVFGEVAQAHAGMLREHLPDDRKPAVEGLDDGVDLDAVAGGQHHGLGHQRRLQHLLDDLGLFGLVGAQLLQDRHRRAAVRNPEKQHAHGFITTSSKVVVDQLGHQICSRLYRSRQIRPQPGLIDLPVAVLGAVEQHHRQPIAELRPQRRIPGGRGGVDIGDRQREAQLVGELRQAVSRPRCRSSSLHA